MRDHGRPGGVGHPATRRPAPSWPSPQTTTVGSWRTAEWARRHGRPFTLLLTGPAGGSFTNGRGGEPIELDAVEFCRTLSGRGPSTGLLSQRVPF